MWMDRQPVYFTFTLLALAEPASNTADLAHIAFEPCAPGSSQYRQTDWLDKDFDVFLTWTSQNQEGFDLR